jgi:60 kDa SS-A/Ro ribonucleoprotein
MRMNVAAVGIPVPRTHEGTPSVRQTAVKELRRAALTALLFEDTFYEKGSQIAARIKSLVPQCDPEAVAALAVEARTKMYLRHLPLFLVREMARTPGNGSVIADTLPRIIERPDELAEYLAMYFNGGDRKAAKEKLSAGSKRGLAAAFMKFDADTLAKYDRDNVVKLRDVLRLVHARPENGLKKIHMLTSAIDAGVSAREATARAFKATPTAGQGEIWRKVVDRTLESPDTWEVSLSTGGDKKATFERLLRDRKLGGMAFLRNLRNMIEARVDEQLIRARFDGPFKYVLPFRFITAARHAPRFEDVIEKAMLRKCEDIPMMSGTTALVVDTSPSMWQDKISAKSEMDRFDAAAALAIIMRERCEAVNVYAFNDRAYEIKPRRGFALRDALADTKNNWSRGGLAVEAANMRGYDRIIVLTDGQWHNMRGQVTSERPAKDASPAPLTDKAYMVNLAPHANGFSTDKWNNVDGFSERILDFIVAFEAEDIP